MTFDDFYSALKSDFIDKTGIKNKKYARLERADFAEFLKMAKGHLHDFAVLQQSGKLTDEEVSFLRQAVMEEEKMYWTGKKRINPEYIEELVNSLFDIALAILIKSVIK